MPHRGIILYRISLIFRSFISFSPGLLFVGRWLLKSLCLLKNREKERYLGGLRGGAL